MCVTIVFFCLDIERGNFALPVVRVKSTGMVELIGLVVRIVFA